jgi:hypothetical protein
MHGLLQMLCLPTTLLTPPMSRSGSLLHFLPQWSPPRPISYGHVKSLVSLFALQSQEPPTAAHMDGAEGTGEPGPWGICWQGRLRVESGPPGGLE